MIASGTKTSCASNLVELAPSDLDCKRYQTQQTWNTQISSVPEPSGCPMAHNISMGWKDSEVNLGMYGDGGRVGYTERPVGRLSVVIGLTLGSDIEWIVRR